VRTEKEIDGVIDRFAALVVEYMECLSGVDREVCRDYLCDLVIGKTFRGWNDRRGALKAQIEDALETPFQYLKDFPQDWRPKTYQLDIAAQHPDTDKWLGIRFLPATLMSQNHPHVREALDEIGRCHQEFADKNWGIALLACYEKKESQPAEIRSDDVQRVVEAWNSLRE